LSEKSEKTFEHRNNYWQIQKLAKGIREEASLALEKMPVMAFICHSSWELMAVGRNCSSCPECVLS